MGVVDLHLHTTYSDGDFGVPSLVDEVVRRGLSGFSVTDHNGLWGCAEARKLAEKKGLLFIEGIELSTRVNEMDVHMLGFSRSFDAERFHVELKPTQEGYMQRTKEMADKCQRSGFDRVSWEAIKARRSHEEYPMYMSYDVRRELMEKHGLDHSQARELTTIGGKCHVPYGDWAMTPVDSIDLIHRVGGKAVLAHPGTIVFEQSQSVLEKTLSELVESGLDGIEVYHPFHDDELAEFLLHFCSTHDLIVTGGSDWHGPDHFKENDRQFGTIGVPIDAIDQLA